MKKILLSLILILSLALLCSCNSQNNAPVGDETTVEVSNNVTLESTQAETQIDTSQTELTEIETTEAETEPTEAETEPTEIETTEAETETTEIETTEAETEPTETETQSKVIEETSIENEQTSIESSETTTEEITDDNSEVVRNSLVYVSELPDDYAEISFVEILPEGFTLINSLSTHKVQENVSDISYNFLGKTYDVSFFAKREIQNPFSLTSGYEKNDYQLIFRSDEANFIFKNGTSELLEAHIFGANDNLSSGKIISKDDAKNIARNFISEYTLKKISSNYYESYSKESDGTHRISYDLVIGGYKVDGEMFVISLRADGEFVLYADRTTGLYDKFIGKVTEADIAEAEKNLYPYRLPGAYGYYTPYLQVGNDGNLYLCSSYLVDEIIDGDEITREYMFYSRVYYEE